MEKTNASCEFGQLTHDLQRAERTIFGNQSAGRRGIELAWIEVSGGIAQLRPSRMLRMEARPVFSRFAPLAI